MKTIQSDPSLAPLITTAVFGMYGLYDTTKFEHLDATFSKLVAFAVSNLKSLHVAIEAYELPWPADIRLTRLSLHRDSNLCDSDYLHFVFAIQTFQ